MDNKYYVPGLHEFHPGFEYEYKEHFGKEWGKWTKNVVTLSTSLFEIGGLLASNSIRVKYLDKEDIESFNTELSAKYGSYIEFNDNLNSNINESNKILYNTDTKLFHIEKYYMSNGDTKPLFNGIINNKSELKILLKQVGVL